MNVLDLTTQPAGWNDSTLYADDLEVGGAYDLGTYTVSAEEIMGFAARWDPQFFHVDEDAADRGHFGGLVASGVHTMSVLQRLAVEGLWGRAATVAARGMREVRFLRPVRPGTTLQGSVVVDEVEHRDASRSLVSVSATLDDDAGRPVLAMVLDVYVARRR